MHKCHLHQEGILWRTTFPVKFLPQEEFWRRIFLVDMMKPSFKVGICLSTKVSDSVLLGHYGP